jgi:hypothetical protein
VHCLSPSVQTLAHTAASPASGPGALASGPESAISPPSPSTWASLPVGPSPPVVESPPVVASRLGEPSLGSVLSGDPVSDEALSTPPPASPASAASAPSYVSS